MPVQKVAAATARNEVMMEDRYDAVFAAAGWRRVGTYAVTRTIPFCSSNRVRLLHYEGPFKGRPHICAIDIPMAHRLYEKRFTNALEKQNLINMQPYGLTMDPEVNSVLRMCL
jgi:hypothetical protein